MTKGLKLLLLIAFMTIIEVSVVACVVDSEEEEPEPEKECTYYQYGDDVVDSVEIMLKKEWRECK